MYLYFPSAFIANTLSLTAMLVLFSMAGKSGLSAELGLIQASTSTLFYAFSANSRNIILGASNSKLAKSIFNIRLILLIPLVLTAFWVNSIFGEITTNFSIIIILRRTVEWLIEVDLSEKERLADKNFALTYIVTEGFLFIFAVLWLLMNIRFPLFGLFCWALLPLFMSLNFFKSALSDFANAMHSITKKIAPHFGSTVVIGISLYMFRTLLILLLGKNDAGDLFAAFAVGGVLGSIILNSFGSSIAFNEKKNGAFKFPRILVFTLRGFLGFGLLFIGLSFSKPSFFSWSHKAIFYWQAIGFSMIGGVVMTHAQLLRSRLLIHNEAHDLYGPDVLMNILIIALVPITYYWGGIQAVSGLSLISALLIFAFYKSSELREIIEINKNIILLKCLQISIALFILIPLFITLNSGIFVDKETVLTGVSSLTSVPFPLSLLLVYLAILAIGEYRSAHFSLTVIFFTLVLMFLSTLIVSTNQAVIGQSKIILIIQFIVPMGALVLGEMFKSNGLDIDNCIEKSFLYVIVTIVPLQLAASWMQGSLQLVSHIYLFTIYQHVDYVPIIFISAFLVIIFRLWSDSFHKGIIFIISPFIGIYTAASLSFTAMFLLIAGMFVFYILRDRAAPDRFAVRITLIVVSSFIGYLKIEMTSAEIISKFCIATLKTVNAWQYYSRDIFNSELSIFFGNYESVYKLKYFSAHNYYLDMIHNFGFISTIPLFAAIVCLVRDTYAARYYLKANTSLLGHLFVLLFLLIIDNSTQVSLRQPYSAIFTFFLWGLFIVRINKVGEIK